MTPTPDDMLFYYHTYNSKTHYFSVYYSVKKAITRIVEISEDELWSLVKEGNLQLEEISPTDFPHKLPGNIFGNVKVFVIR
jgi:hypothetical protein